MSKFLDQSGVSILWTLMKDKGSKRDNYFNYEDTYVPDNGQICFVDTAKDGLQIKIGDGITPWIQLSYLQASEDSAGIMKLYQSLGTNTDGAISQKVITDELENKFSVEVNNSQELIRFYK